jgi:hypothetical protein
MRVAQQLVAALVEPLDLLRVTRVAVEIVGQSDREDALRASRVAIEVLADPTGIYTVGASHTLALTHAANIAAYSCLAAHTLDLTHAATFNLVREVAAEHSLSLLHEATGSFIIEVAAEHTLTLSQEALVTSLKTVMDVLGLSHVAVAECIKPVAHTIGLTQEALETAVYERLAVHNLDLSEEASVAYTKYVMGIHLLEIVDVAVANVIKPVQHTLTLTHLASLDVIRRGSDTLTPIHEASVEVVYARASSHTLSMGEQATRQTEFARTIEHTLSLGQSAVGDQCRVVISTIDLSDEAVAELVRTATDDLVVTHLAESNWVFIRRRTDNLSLSHVAADVVVRPRSGVSSLALTHAAVVVSGKSVVDTLTLTHVASVDNIRRASSTLAMTHEASVTNTRLSAHDDLLSLSHTAVVGFVKQVFAANTLSLSHLAGSGIKIGSAVSVLQETHYTSDPETGEEVPYYIGLQDVATVAVVRNAPYTASHIISFAEHAVGIVVHADAIAVDATDALSLSHAAYANKAPTAAHTLAMTDLAIAVVSKAVSDALTLTDTATLNVFRATLTITDTLALGQSVAVVVLATNILCQYHPIVGEGATGNPTPPTATLLGPMPGIEAPFQLVYPATGTVLDSVTLRAPELGNKDRLSFNRVIRETRGGTLVVFADPMWPKIQTLALSFTGLRRSEAQDLLDFFDDYLGLEIGMIDWEQRYWVGIVTTPEEPIIEDVFNSYSVKFEFEGELDPTWLPQVIPYIPGTPLRRTRRDRFRSGLENPEEPMPPEVPEDSYYALADAAMSAGQVLYIKSNGHVAPARANAAATTGAIGLVFADVDTGETACYITEGHITLADWSAVAGVVSLTPGSNYFLSTSAAGKIVAVAPTAQGDYVVRVGRATSGTTLDIEIGSPIRL